MTRIEEIKARLAAATPGPWETHDGYIVLHPRNPSERHREADLQLMAHAPTDIATLLEIIETIEAKQLERAQSLEATAKRMLREWSEGRPDADAAYASNFRCYASEAEANYGTIRMITNDQGHLL